MADLDQKFDLEIETLIEYLYSHFRKNPHDIPAFPTVASRLIASLEQKDVKVSEVKELIQQDAATSARVISASNSALFGGVQEISSIQTAVVRLGFRETADLAVAVAYKTLFDIEARARYSLFQDVWDQFYDYCLLVGYGAKFIGREMKRGKPDILFLSGMFHDIGKLLILQAISTGVVRGKVKIEVTKPHLFELFEELHEDIGVEFLVNNHIPEEVIVVAQDHHRLGLELTIDTLNTHIVRLASAMAQKLKMFPLIEFYDYPHGFSEESSETIQVLRLTEKKVEYLERQFATIADQVKEFRQKISQDSPGEKAP